MTLRIKLLALLLSMAASSINFAQRALDYVPADVSFIFSMNADNLNQKVDVMQFQQLEFYDTMVEQVSREFGPEQGDLIFGLFTSPSQYGVDLMKPAHVFAHFKDGGKFFGFVFELSDQKKFQQLLADMFPSDEFTQWSEGGNQFLNIEKKTVFGFNEGIGFLGGGSLDMDYSAIWEYTDEDWALFEEQQANAVKEWTQSVMARSFGGSITSNSFYKKAAGPAADFRFWGDYSSFLQYFMENTGGMMGGMGMNEGMMSVLGGMYMGTYMAMDLNFNPGKMDMGFRFFGNEKMMDQMRKTLDSKTNKKLAKYIRQEDMLGYFSMDYNLPNLMEAYKDVMISVAAGMPEAEELMPAILDVVDIALDGEALYDLWEGDLVFAVTGIKEFQKTVITYEYDEDFNAKEVERVVTERLPEFTAMISYDNEKNLSKIVRLGEVAKVLEKNGAYYQLTLPDMPSDMFLAMHDGIMFFTNNADLVQYRLEKGYPKGAYLDKGHSKRLKDNAQTFYWDIPKTMGVMKMMGIPMEGPEAIFMEAGQQPFESLSMTSSKKIGDAMTGQFSISLKNKEENALKVLMNFLNEVVMSAMGGKKT